MVRFYFVLTKADNQDIYLSPQLRYRAERTMDDHHCTLHEDVAGHARDYSFQCNDSAKILRRASLAQDDKLVSWCVFTSC